LGIWFGGIGLYKRVFSCFSLENKRDHNQNRKEGAAKLFRQKSPQNMGL
jgi:hypothetical protein